MKTPRRIRLDLYTPTEAAIYHAAQMVEKMPPDVRLTLAGEKLREARELVGEFIDEQLQTYQSNPKRREGRRQ
jgi:hypothetical protein